MSQTKISDTDGVALVNHYNSNCTAKWQDDPGRIMRHTYSPLVTTITDPKGVLHAARHVSRRLTQMNDGPGTSVSRTWRSAYDPQTMGVTAATDPRGRTWKGTWNAQGNLRSATDPLDHTTAYEYNSLGEVTSATDPLGVSTS